MTNKKQTVKFGDICREVKLSSKDPLAEGYDKYIGLEHLDSGSLQIKRWGSIAEDKPSFTRVFKKGHILFGKRRSYLKKAAIAEFDGVCSGNIIVMEPQVDFMLPELLPFIVQSEKFWDWAIKISSGSLSPRTKFKGLSALELTLPSIEEQYKRLSVLNKAMAAFEKNNFALGSLATLRKSFCCFQCVVRRMGKGDSRNPSTPNKAFYTKSTPDSQIPIPAQSTGKMPRRTY